MAAWQDSETAMSSVCGITSWALECVNVDCRAQIGCLVGRELQARLLIADSLSILAAEISSLATHSSHYVLDLFRGLHPLAFNDVDQAHEVVALALEPVPEVQFLSVAGGCGSSRRQTKRGPSPAWRFPRCQYAFNNVTLPSSRSTTAQVQTSEKRAGPSQMRPGAQEDVALAWIWARVQPPKPRCLPRSREPSASGSASSLARDFFPLARFLYH